MIIRVHYVHSKEVAITSGICESSLSVQAYGSRLYLFWRRSHFGASFIILVSLSSQASLAILYFMVINHQKLYRASQARIYKADS